MIVPMKCVALLAMASCEKEALTVLRDLGVMQIVPGNGRTHGLPESREAVSAGRKILAALAEFSEESPEDAFLPEEPGKELIKRAGALLERRTALEAERRTIEQKLKRLAPFGDFDRRLLDSLKKEGIEVFLCLGPANRFEEARAAGITVEKISSTQNEVAFAALFAGPPAPEIVAKLPLFRLAPEDDPAELGKMAEKKRKEAADLEKVLRAMARQLPALQAEQKLREETADFAAAADSLQQEGELCFLQGFVPEPKIAALKETARKNSWGLLITDPAEEDDVPVLLENNRFTRIIRPLFSFLGIVPGYRELDVSGCVLLFFTLFYAIIVGDAGYGVCFSLAALAGLHASRKRPALRYPCRMFLIFSLAAAVWGALCGSWFGLERIPGTSHPFPALPALKNFASDTVKQANVQFFCFILAVAQLSTGRIWRAIHDRNWRSICENLGWTLILWGNFFLTIRLIVYPGEFPKFMYWLYGTGLLLVVVFGVRWNSISDVFQFPFNVIGTFTDILSYIRLFAVAMSGACIASSFNGMAFDVVQASAWLLPAGILIALAGHLLNIALAFMGVLVHAVRLNTLEFSNHAGLSWSGREFHPFQNSNQNHKEQ